MSKFKTRVKILAEHNALSLAEVSRRCGWNVSQLGVILSKGNPTLSTMQKIADALGVHVMELLRDED